MEVNSHISCQMNLSCLVMIGRANALNLTVDGAVDTHDDTKQWKKTV